MKRILTVMMFAVAGLTLIGPASSAQADIWVNELHYDNTGVDVGEFFEVVIAPNMSSVDLSSVTLSLYNGSNGTIYDTHTLDTFTLGSTVNGFQIYSKAIAGIQNGAPDGWALDSAGTVLEFFSYEGTMTATAGVANGLTSVDIGVLELGTTAVGFSLQLQGNGTTQADFAWAGPQASTVGGVNAGQAFAIPEPSSLLALGLIAGALASVRRRR